MMTRVRLPLLALLIAALAVPAAHPLFARQAAAPRPVVLLVHGRGYIDRDSAAFRRQALRALRQGAFAATNDSLLADDDVRLVWYADLLDRRRPSDATRQPCQLSDSPVSIIQAFALIASELISLDTATAEGSEARGFAADLRFFGNPATRCAAEQRIGDAVARAHGEGRPVVLVGHSLGALVAWGHLQHRGQGDARELAEVRRLVTIGSPIGSRGLRELLLGDSSALVLPRGVRSWINVVNENDPFASRLAGVDSATGRQRALAGISDVFADAAGEDAHEIRGYLRAPATTKAIVGAWCDALGGRDAPAACATLQKPEK